MTTGEHNEAFEYTPEEKELEKKCDLGEIPTLNIAPIELDNIAAAQKKGSETRLSQNPNVPKITVKDCGYAWVILAAMVVCNILTTGYAKGFGLLSSAIFDTYPNSSTAIAGVMMGLLSGFRTLFTPVAGMMANKLGIRKTMYLGVVIFCVGLIASFFCTSTYQLTITLGAMMGLSHCLIETSQIVVISNYFEAKLPFANGIRVAGSPCGGILYPMMLAMFLQHLGLKNTFLLLAGVATHLFICTTLVRPIDVQLRIKALRHVHKTFREVESGCQPTPQSKAVAIKQASDTSITETTISLRKKNLFNEILTKNPTNSSQMKKKPLNIKFLKDPVYFLFLLFAAGSPMAFPLGLYYISIYAKTVVGLTMYEVSAVLSFQAILDSLLRLFIGWLNNKGYYKKTHGFVFCLWLNAVGSMIVPLATTFWSMMCAVVLISFGPASFHTFSNVILAEQFGKENISTTWGFMRMTQGVFSFIHPTIIGLLVDSTGGYTIPFIIMGIASFYAGAILLLQYPVIKLTKSKIVIC